MKNKFCVIGDKGTSNPVQRTWLETKEAAESHARGLIYKAIRNGEKPKALFVMECTSIVGPLEPEIRTVKPDDFEMMD